MNILKVDKNLVLVSNKLQHDLGKGKKIVQIDKDLITPINLQNYVTKSEKKNLLSSKRNSIEKENLKSIPKIPIVGKDIVFNFKRHFANILWRNYKTYLFRNRVRDLFNQIRRVKLLYKIFSKVLFRNFAFKIHSQIKTIQTFVKFKNDKNRLLEFYQKSSNICKCKLKFFYNKFKNRIKHIKYNRRSLKEKIHNLRSNMLIKSRSIFNKLIKNKETTNILSSKVYNEVKLKIKILHLFINP